MIVAICQQKRQACPFDETITQLSVAHSDGTEFDETLTIVSLDQSDGMLNRKFHNNRIFYKMLFPLESINQLLYVILFKFQKWIRC